MTQPSPSPITFDISESGFAVNGMALEFTLEGFTRAFGEPRVVEIPPSPYDEQPTTRLIWDDYGIAATLDGPALSTFFSVRISEDEVWEADRQGNVDPDHSAHSTLRGTVTVDGTPVLDALPEDELEWLGSAVDIERAGWEVTFWVREEYASIVDALDMNERFGPKRDAYVKTILAAEQPFREVEFMGTDPVVRQEPSGKWNIPQVDEPVLEFDSFLFKLAVIQELMYEQKLLHPEMNVFEFADGLGEDSFDPEDYLDEIVPQVRDWFMAYLIPARLAEKVEKLEFFFSGSAAHEQVAPFWDGEDDLLTLYSITARELDQFPRLRSVEDEANFVGPDVRQVLEDRGIRIIVN